MTLPVTFMTPQVTSRTATDATYAPDDIDDAKMLLFGCGGTTHIDGTFAPGLLIRCAIDTQNRAATNMLRIC